MSPEDKEDTKPKEGEGDLDDLDLDLNDDFKEDSDDKKEGDDKKEDKSTTKADDSRIVRLEETIGTLRDNLTALQTENNIIRGLLRDSEEGDDKKSSKKEESDDFEIDEAAFNTQLQVNPAKAISDVIRRAITSHSTRMDSRTADTVSTQSRMNELKQADRDRTNAEYGEFLSNKEFRDLAEQVYSQLTADTNGEWKPASLYTATSIAYAQLSRQGKLKSPAKLREKERSPVQNLLSSDGDGKDDASSAGDLSARDLAQIDRVCKEWGISREKYLKQYADLKKENPHYGTGR